MMTQTILIERITNDLTQLEKENTELKNQLSTRDEKIKYLSGWLNEFAKLQGKTLDETNVFDEDILNEICFNIENQMDVDAYNIEILEKKICAQDRLIRNQSHLIDKLLPSKEIESSQTDTDIPEW